jgi:hypothetical protein
VLPAAQVSAAPPRLAQPSKIRQTFTSSISDFKNAIILDESFSPVDHRYLPPDIEDDADNAVCEVPHGDSDARPLRHSLSNEYLSAAARPLTDSHAKANSNARWHAFQYSIKGRAHPIQEYVEILFSMPALVDDAYQELTQKARQKNSQDIEIHVFELLLVLATFFVPSEAAQPGIRSTLASAALYGTFRVKPIAQLAYTRLDARCSAGTNARMLPASVISEIPSHPDGCSLVFGISLYELMRRQYRAEPDANIPVFLRQICAYLLKCPGIEKVGVFQNRVPVGEVDAMAFAVDSGEDVFVGDELKCHAALLRKWLADLPVPLISPIAYPALMEGRAKENFIPVIEAMDPLNRNSLAFLVQFMKRTAALGDDPRISWKMLSGSLGGLCLRIANENTQTLREYSELTRAVFAVLSNSWDVASVWDEEIGVQRPKPSDYLLPSKSTVSFSPANLARATRFESKK